MGYQSTEESTKSLPTKWKQLEFEALKAKEAMLDDSSKMPVMAVIATIELAFPYMKAIADGMPELEINNTRDFLGLVYAGLRCAKQAAITDGEKNVIQEHFDMFILINW